MVNAHDDVRSLSVEVENILTSSKYPPGLGDIRKGLDTKQKAGPKFLNQAGA